MILNVEILVNKYLYVKFIYISNIFDVIISTYYELHNIYCDQI